MAFCKEFNARTQGIKARLIRGHICCRFALLTKPRRGPWTYLARRMFRCRCW